ncbi:hypothetical protein NC652_022358 [Populus alba x Populus x berolinensis]|nr:hypothetical protein NC652_022358 [Populus alba x Populus x berolinensis]
MEMEMDHFFQQQLLQGDVFCYENGPVNQSAFVPYICRPWGGREVGLGSSSMEVHPTNMSRRMIEFMRRSFTVKIETQEPDSKRCYRHKMSERLRRQRERNGYLALHSLLPHDTKKDKNSIMLMAAKKIQELEMYKEMLKGRNDEIEERLAASGIRNVESTKIRIKVANPTSGVDPMIDVLKCLKSLGTKTRSIQSQFSNQELVAVMEIESEMVKEAIVALKGRSGSSQIEIAKFIEEKHKSNLPTNFKKLLLVHLKKLVAYGKLVKVKNSFKLPPKSSAKDAASVKKAAPAKPEAEAKPKPEKAAKAEAVKFPAKKAVVAPKNKTLAKKAVKKPKSIKAPVKKAVRKTKKGSELRLNSGPGRIQDDVFPNRARLEDGAWVCVKLVDGFCFSPQIAHICQAFVPLWINQELVVPIFPCYQLHSFCTNQSQVHFLSRPRDRVQNSAYIGPQSGIPSSHLPVFLELTGGLSSLIDVVLCFRGCPLDLRHCAFVTTRKKRRSTGCMADKPDGRVVLTLGGAPTELVQKSLALSTSWQYLSNALANLLWDFNWEFTLTALLVVMALLFKIPEKHTLFHYYHVPDDNQRE